MHRAGGYHANVLGEALSPAGPQHSVTAFPRLNSLCFAGRCDIIASYLAYASMRSLAPLSEKFLRP
jgi:hypothetical protein